MFFFKSLNCYFQSLSAFLHGNNRRIKATKNGTLPKLFLPNISQCAEYNQTFCTKNANYPTDYIRKLLQENFNEFSHFFRVHEIYEPNEHTRVSVIRKPTFIFRLTNVSTLRRGAAASSEPDVIDLCESYEKMICPTSAKNVNGDELFILNTNEHKQCVRVRVCPDIGTECQDYASFPNGYKSRCQQQNIFIELASLTLDGKTSVDRFTFPAACSCEMVRSPKELSYKTAN